MISDWKDAVCHEDKRPIYMIIWDSYDPHPIGHRYFFDKQEAAEFARQLGIRNPTIYLWDVFWKRFDTCGES